MKKSFFKKLINNFREELPLQAVNTLVFLSDFFLSAKNKHAQNSKSILIVRTDLLGDFVVWSNAYNLICEKYKKENYKIVLLGNEAWTELAKKINHFDEIIPLNRKKYFKDFSYRQNILKELNKYNFEYLFQTSYSRDFAVADSITRNVSAKNKVGFKRNPEAEFAIWDFLSNGWYTNLISADKKEAFEFYRILQFLNELGLKKEKYSTDFSADFPKKKDTENYFVVLPGAGAGKRCLEPEKFAEITKRISALTGWLCILCGSKTEASIGEKIESNLNLKIKNLIGKTNLIELGECLTNSKLVIGNETGTLHYAAALNAPTVCALGGGHFKKVMPYDEKIAGNNYLPVAVYNKMDCFNCNWRCVYVTEKNKVVPCISTISTDYLWEKTELLIKKISSQEPSIQK